MEHERPGLDATIGTIFTVLGVLVAVLAWLSPRAPASDPMNSGTATPAASTIGTSIAQPHSPEHLRVTGTTPSLPAPLPTPSVRHEGEYTLFIGAKGPDLDASPRDHQWLGNGISEMGLTSYDGIQVTDGNIASLQGKAEPNCFEASNYQAQSSAIDVETKLHSGNPWLCVRTGEGRFAAIRVLEVKKKSHPDTGRVYDSVRMAIRVYEKAS